MVEALGLWSMEQIDLAGLLQSLGLSGPLRSAAMASIIGRMAAPASEHATYEWMTQRSALGELLDVDFAAMPLMTLYRASDALLKHRDSIERQVFSRVSELFGLSTTVTLYDLTNTYMEGEATSNPKAKHARSKEKRSDCPLVTLALVLDSSGFVRESRSFAGNVSEGDTLEQMLKALNVPKGALVVMDAGIAKEENLTWLRDNGYRYLAVSRDTSTGSAQESRANSTRSRRFRSKMPAATPCGCKKLSMKRPAKPVFTAIPKVASAKNSRLPKILRTNLKPNCKSSTMA